MENLKLCRCGCYGEGVAIEVDPDGDTVDLAFVKFGQHKPLSLAFRIRQIVKILRDGTPYTDMVVLSPESAKSLATSLNEAADAAMLKRAEASGGANSQNQVHDPVSR